MSDRLTLDNMLRLREHAKSTYTRPDPRQYFPVGIYEKLWKTVEHTFFEYASNRAMHPEEFHRTGRCDENPAGLPQHDFPASVQRLLASQRAHRDEVDDLEFFDAFIVRKFRGTGLDCTYDGYSFHITWVWPPAPGSTTTTTHGELSPTTQ